jgi:hypothetical protein
LGRSLGAVLPALALLAVGCGGSGVSDGATVSIYVAAPLCKEAEGEAGDAGDLEVRVLCLPPMEKGGKADLVAAGANARRATEDSTSVAFLEAPGPAARFSRPIVESAKVAWLETSDGTEGMRRLLRALDERGSTSPREAVLEQVG